MTTLSPESADAGVVATEDLGRLTVRPSPLTGRELRSGGWTRLGSSSVLGDAVTEHTLTGLAAQTRSAARAQGYAVGWAEGRRAAEERAREAETQAAERRRDEEARREAEHQAALDGLARSAHALRQALETTCAQVEGQAVDVAVTLAEELVGHELSIAEHPGLDAVRRALALLPGEPVVRIRVCPADAADLVTMAEIDEVAGGATVVADPTLRRGDALVETAEGVLDARISDAARRVREVLLP